MLLIRYPHRVFFFIAITIYSSFNQRETIMSWDENKVKILKECWGKLTASQIAAKIEGVTRNAVIGKAHRLNLQTKTTSKKIVSKLKSENNDTEVKQQKLTSKISKFKALLLDPSFPPEQPTKLLDLTDEHCRWPLGEKMKPATFFCGRKIIESQNSGKKLKYCALHLLYGYVQKSDKEEDQISDGDLPQFLEKKIKIKSA